MSDLQNELPRVAANDFTEFIEMLENATDEQLINYYNAICNQSIAFIDISQKFQIPIIKDGSLNNSPVYRKRRNQWHNELIQHITERLNNLPPLTQPIQQAPKINSRGFDTDEINDLGLETPSILLKPIDNKPIDKLYFQSMISPNQLNKVILKPIEEKPQDKLRLPEINQYELNKVHLKQLTENDELRRRVQQLERENQLLRNYIHEINNKRLIQEQELKRAQNIIKKQNKLRLIDIHDKQAEITNIRIDKERTKNRNKTLLISAFDEFATNHKKFKPQSFKEWQQLQKSPQAQQDKLVQETIQYIKEHPTNWEVNRKLFSDYGLKKLTPLLIDVLENDIIKQISARQRNLKFSYYVHSFGGGQQLEGWKSRPINRESLTKLIDSLKNHGLMFADIEEVPWVTSDDMFKGELLWAYFDIFGIHEIYSPDKLKATYKTSKSGANRPDTHKESEGGFFPYWNTTDIDLSRYQVLSKTNFLYNNSIHKIPCVFFALENLAKDGVIDEGKLTSCVAGFFMRSTNKKETEWTCNFYNMKHINFACQNLHIGCRVHYYDEDSLNNEIRTRFIGDKSSKTIIELGLYKEHYFIWEKTNYTRYFVQHYQELKNEKNANLIRGTRKSGGFRRESDPKRFLNSLELLREMMRQNMFEEMNFKDIYELETPIDNTKRISEQLPKGYVCVGLKTTANGDLIPEIVKKDDEEEETQEDIKETANKSRFESHSDEIEEEKPIKYISNIHFISSSDSEDMFEEQREIDLSDVPIAHQLTFLALA